MTPPDPDSFWWGGLTDRRGGIILSVVFCALIVAAWAILGAVWGVVALVAVALFWCWANA